jgi:hypothetical protein
VASATPWLILVEAAAYESAANAGSVREAKVGRLQHARVSGRGESMLLREWLDEHVLAMSCPVAINVRRRNA